MQKKLADLLLNSPWWFYRRLPLNVIGFAWKKAGKIKPRHK